MTCTRAQCNKFAGGRTAGMRRISAVIVAGAVLYAIGAAPGAPASVVGPHGPVVVVARSEDGIQRLLDAIQWLMILLGGSGDSIPSDPNEAIYVLVAQYQQHGPPLGLSEAELADARALVEEAWDALGGVASELHATAAALMEQMLQSLYADLGGDPTKLP